MFRPDMWSRIAEVHWQCVAVSLVSNVMRIYDDSIDTSERLEEVTVAVNLLGSPPWADAPTASIRVGETIDNRPLNRAITRRAWTGAALLTAVLVEGSGPSPIGEAILNSVLARYTPTFFIGETTLVQGM